MRGSLLALTLSSAIALPSPVFAAPAPAPRDLPSPTTAGALAIGLSLGSIGLMYGATAADQPALGLVGMLSLIVTPSGGHFYAGEHGRAWRGVAVRGGAMTVLVIGAVIEADQCLVIFGDEPSGCSGLTPARALMLTGGLTFTAMMIADWIDAPGAARRQRERGGLALVPLPVRGGATLNLVMSSW